MVKISNMLKEKDFQFLRTLKGETLKKIEGYLLFNNPDLYTGVLRVCTCKTEFNFLCRFDVLKFGEDDDSKEEFATFRISRRDEEIWLPSDTKLTKTKFNNVIEDILIVNYKVRIKEFNNSLDADYTQAVIFGLNDCFLVIQKETWMSEFISVRKGEGFTQLLKDETRDWDIEDENGTCKIEQEIVRLDEPDEIEKKIVLGE